jgi:hypothetical protein
MMRKNLNRRLEAIDRQISRENPAEKWYFLEPASKVVVAYYAGDLQPNDDPWRAFKKALNYAESDLYGFYDDLRKDNVAGVKRRYDKAAAPVFEKFGYDYFPKDKWEEGIANWRNNCRPSGKSGSNAKSMSPTWPVETLLHSGEYSIYAIRASKDDLRKSRVFTQKASVTRPSEQELKEMQIGARSQTEQSRHESVAAFMQTCSRSTRGLLCQGKVR